jgi:tRNA (cmo5U34)-methyltransferase
MHRDEEIFQQQAANYDSQWAKTAPIRHCLHLLLDSLFAGLPIDAHILCVGVGTGTEMAHLARQNPGWHFTAVEPSSATLDICRQRADEEGFASRCDFHQGYLESLPATQPHNAATCFLVSQFIREPQARSAFFAGIAERLKPGGLLASSDLAADVSSAEYEVLLAAWMNMMAVAEVSPEAMTRMRQAYARDVGVLSPQRTAAIITAGGFALPVPFFQVGLIHAWLSRRA